MVRDQHGNQVERASLRNFLWAYRWDYVVEHNVQLPDEYDEIYQDLEPYWGIDPLDFQKNIEQLEAQENTVVIAKTEQNSFIEVVDYHLPQDSVQMLLDRIDNVLEFLKDIEHHLPPFRAVFSPHDNPSMLSDYGIKSMALEAAAARFSMFFVTVALQRILLTRC